MTNLANSVKGDSISPPVAARTYAYGAIAMYEAVVHGMPGYQSLAGQLNGLDSLPEPDPNLEYDWPTVLAHTMSRVALATYVFPERVFFEFITPVQASLTALGRSQVGYRRTAGVPESTIDNSIAFAEELADALIAWANADGYSDIRYKGYVEPSGPDKWVPTGFSDQDKVANPIEPYFGTLRTLALSSPDECTPQPPVPFSTDPESEFYQQAETTRQAVINLTEEQMIIARFWEDNPGPTSTPPGHWTEITIDLVRDRNLADAVAAFAWLSTGFYDSFISCWEAKYRYNLVRPQTYIRRHIDSDWMPLLSTPQFPTYTSGHSCQSATSAILLGDIFGSDFAFTDRTKVRRGFAPRTFANFVEAAEEAAVSRLYGGIHYPMDNNVGVDQGFCVGNTIGSRISLTPQ